MQIRRGHSASHLHSDRVHLRRGLRCTARRLHAVHPSKRHPGSDFEDGMLIPVFVGNEVYRFPLVPLCS